jgi:hypothetical protein
LLHLQQQWAHLPLLQASCVTAAALLLAAAHSQPLPRCRCRWYCQQSLRQARPQQHVLLRSHHCLLRQPLQLLPQLLQRETRSAPEVQQLQVLPGGLLQ